MNDSVTLDLLIIPLSEEIVSRYDVSDLAAIPNATWIIAILFFFQLIVLTDSTLKEQLLVNEWTRKHGKKFMNVECRGLFGKIFNDFGSSHVVDDPDGEQRKEVLIEHVDKVSELEKSRQNVCSSWHGLSFRFQSSGDVICLEESRHDMEDGDYVTFTEVKGMTELNNCQPRKIKVLGKKAIV